MADKKIRSKCEYANKFRRQREKIRDLLEHIDSERNEFFKAKKQTAIV